MNRAAIYIRTDNSGNLPPYEEQRETLHAYARDKGYELLAEYSDINATGHLLYHRPGIKQAIENIKDAEEWDVLLVADPRCISDTETALHELVHKFSLYNNRIECPTRSWEEFLTVMKDYRRNMARS